MKRLNLFLSLFVALLGASPVFGQLNTTTTVTPSSNPWTFGQNVNFAATVIASGGQAAQGTVAWSIACSNGNSTILDGSGVATCVNNTLPVGSTSVSASYTPSSSALYNPSFGVVIENINKAVTAVGIVSSLNPSTIGTSVTFTATVTGGVNPTGAITWSVGNCSAGNLTGAPPFTATCTTSSLAVGSPSVTATYAGDTNNATANNSITQTVNKAVPTVTVTSSANPSTSRASVTLTATLSGASSPTASVAWKSGGSGITGCAAAPIIGTAAICTTTTLTAGSDAITADYAGDANNAAAEGTLTQVVQTSTTTTVTSSSTMSTSTFGQSVTFTAAITGGSSPSGSVAWTLGGNPIAGCASTTVASAMSTCTTTALPVSGADTVNATYSGDTVNLTSNGSVTQVVNKAPTSVSMTSSPNPSTFGQSVTFTATLMNTGTSTTASTATGSITWSGDVSGCGSTALSNGTATCMLATLAVGGHSSQIMAQYTAGDTNFTASAVASVSQTVNKGTPAVSVTSGTNPSAFGASVTFTATVTGPNGVTAPSGSVSFSANGSTSLCSGVTLSGGMAMCATSSLPTGTDTITATYSGDTNYATNTGGLPGGQGVGKLTPTVSASSSGPSIYGQTVTLSATISTASMPAGNVAWTAAGNAIPTCGGTAVTVSNGMGTATCQTTALPVGTPAIVATYSGDTNNALAASPQFSQTVGKATPTVTVTSSTNPSSLNASVTFTATVAATGSPASLASGMVTWSANTNCGTTNLNGAGITTCTTTILPTGMNTVTASYSGDGNYLAGNPGSVAQSVNTSSTSISVASSLNPSAFNQSVTFTATITGSNPTGTVKWSANTGCADSAIAGGQATCATTALPVGSNSVAANYQGDANNAAGSGTVSQTVNKASTSVSVSSGTNPSTFGQSVTFTAVVTGVNPTGSVSWTTTNNANITCSSSSFTNGTGTCVTSTLSVGTDTVTATYSGDGNNATSNASLGGGQVVNKTASGITVTSSLNPSGFGQQVTFTATLTGNTPFTGTVNWSANTGCIASAVTAGTIAGTGTATCNTTMLPVGTGETIMASYSGDAINAAGSNSLSSGQAVNKAISTVTITSATNPSTFGNAVMLTATITAPGGTTPPQTATGSVTWSSNTGCGSTTVTGGVTTCTTSTVTPLALGANTIAAAYAGDTSYTPASAPSFTQTVSQSATTVAVTSGTNPSTFGGSVTFTASITGKGTVGGTVTWSATNTGSPISIGCGTTPVTAGVATCTTSALTGGTDTVTASYSGDTNNLNATGSITNQVVNPASQTVTFGPLTDVTFGATIPSLTATASSGLTAFNFTSTSVAVCTVSGSTVSLLSSGTCSLTATQPGNASYSSASASASFMVRGPVTIMATPTSIMQTAPAGSSFTYPLTVSVVDSLGNLVSGVPVTFTAPSTGPSAVFTGSTNTITATTVGGYATTGTVTAGSKPGNYTVTTSVAGAVGATIVTTATFGLTNGAGQPFAITLANTAESAQINTTYAPLSATVTDAAGNKVTDGTSVLFTVQNCSTLTPTSAPNAYFTTTGNGGATQSCSDLETTTNGVAATKIPLIANAFTGGFTVMVSSGAAAAVTAALTNTAGAANALQYVSGNNQFVNVNSQYSALIVKVVDAAGNPVGGQQVTFTINSSTGGATALPVGNTVVTTGTSGNSLGQASLSLTANSTAGLFTVVAATSVGNSTGSFTFNLTNLAPLSINATGGISPNSASENSTSSVSVTISGSGFITGDTVTFLRGGITTVLNSTVNSLNSITATIPASLLATPAGSSNLPNKEVETITVTSPASPGVTPTTASGTFTINPPPTATGLSPATANVGDPNFNLSISGTNFVSPSVLITSTAGVSQSIQPTLNANGLNVPLSPVILTSFAPAISGSVASVPLSVSVIDSGTTSTLTNAFAVVFPQISSLSPASVASGGVQFTLTVNGSNLLTGSVVHWCGSGTGCTPATGDISLVSTLTTNSSGNVVLQAVVPASLISAAGSAVITVVNNRAYPAQTASNQVMFNFGGLQLTSINPTTAQAGSANAVNLSLTGLNFEKDAVVHFVNGTSDSTLTTTATIAGSTTQLSATIPASMLVNTGVVSISVQNVADNVRSNSLPFNIVQSSITSLSVSSVAAGTPGITLTITGTNFVSTPTVPTVQYVINGGAAVSLTPSQTTSTQITVSVPAAQLVTAGAAQISVMNSGALSSNTVTLNVVNPAITMLTPNSAPVGAATFQMTVTGSNFLSGSTVNWFDGTKTTVLTATLSDSSHLSATVPSTLLAATASVVVTVTNPGGGSPAPVSNAVTFAVGPAPTIDPVSAGGLSPSTIAAGSPQFTLTVTGTNFSSGSVVNWDPGTGTVTKLTTYLSDTVHFTALTATVPASLLAAQGTVTITVTNAGPVTSNPVQFMITAGLTPAITNLTPNSVTVNPTAALAVSVLGSNFLQGATVQFTSLSGAMTLTPTFVSSTQLNISVPISLLTMAGAATVTVTNPGGGVSNSATFTVNPPNQVSLTSLQVNTAAAGSGTLLDTITGVNFVNGAVVLWNNGTATTQLSTQFAGSTSLTAIIPPADLTTPGIAFVSVQNPDKTVSNTLLFTIAGALPSITSLSQNSAPAGTSNLSLTVNGTGFSAGTSTVIWGTTPLPTLFVSATQLSVTITATLLANPGTTNVTVQTSGGTSNAVTFSVGAPTILALAPSSATVGATGLTLNVGGQNFISGSTVQWQTTALTTTFVSASQLTATVPSGLLATAGAINVTVQNPGGATSAPSPFTVGTGPAIATVSPITVSAGSGAFTLTVTGTNFLAGDQILWNGIPLNTTFGSATQLTGAVPASLTAMADTINVEVLHVGGVLSNLMTFSLAGPTVTSVTPASGAAGLASASLTLMGTNFVPTSTVNWNGTAVPTAFVNATTVTAQIGSALLQNPGTAFLTVSNGGSTSAPTTFQIASPSLASLTPGTAVAGAGVLSITLTGTNFANGSTANWNGTVVATSFVSSTQLIATVPANLTAIAGTNIINVTNPGGSSSGIAVFSLTAPPPASITSFQPSSAIAGSQAFILSVTGSGFNSTSAVVWNGSALPTTVVSATQVTAFVNSTLVAQQVVANVIVQNSGATGAVPAAFAVNGPSIAALSPSTTSAGGPSFNLAVTGANFLPGSLIQWNSVSLPTAFNSATALTASVPASLVAGGGTASITVQNPGGATSPASQFTIGPFTLSITTVSLPDAIVGQIYAAPALQATGGTTPYTWSVTGGVIPQGLTLDPASGTITGTATVPGIASLTITLTDTVMRTVSKTIALHVVLPLTVTNTTPLTPATISSAYSLLLIASGGTPPYTWSAGGSLPAGLLLNQSSGQISGTPLVPGLAQFSITATDSRSLSITSPFSLTTALQSVTIGGITSSLSPAQQPTLKLTLGGPYTVDLSGFLNLAFASAVGSDDQTIQFSTGGRQVAFTLPAGTTQPLFGGSSSVAMSTGTVAGSITVSAAVQAGTASVTPTPVPSQTGTIAKAVPVLTSATLTRVTGGINVSITGYSTTRDMTSATITFNPATGSTITSAPITVQLSSAFTTWYSSAASTAVGSSFTITLPFTVTGNTNAIGSATVIMTNSQGASQAITAM